MFVTAPGQKCGGSVSAAEGVAVGVVGIAVGRGTAATAPDVLSIAQVHVPAQVGGSERAAGRPFTRADDLPGARRGECGERER